MSQRIVALLAGKSKYAYRDERDRELYESIMNAEQLKTLPRGVIVGLMLIDQAGTQDDLKINTPWAFGPYLYHIKSVIRLPSPISYKGNLGLIHIDNNIQDIILKQPGVMEQIQEWKDVSPGLVWGDESLRALTIKQPPAEAIMSGHKTVENRTRSIFRINK